MSVFNYGGEVAVLDFGNQTEQYVNRKAFAENIARIFDFITHVEAVAGRQAVNQFVFVDIDFINSLFDDFGNVRFGYGTVFVDGNGRVLDDAFDFVAGDVDDDAVNAFVGHLFGGFHRVTDRIGGLFDVGDDAVFDSLGRIVAVAGNADFLIAADAGNDAADFGRADVQSGNCGQSVK